MDSCKSEITWISREPESKHHSLVMDSREVPSTSKSDSMLSNISRTMMEFAVDNYYAQTVSSQYMTHMSQSDLFDEPFRLNEESQSLLRARNETPELVLNGDVLCDCPELLSNCEHKIKTAPTFINASQTDLFDVPFTWKDQESQSLLKDKDGSPKLVLTKDILCDSPEVLGNFPHKMKKAPRCVNTSQTDLLDVPFTWKDQESQSLLKDKDGSPKLVLTKDILRDSPEVLGNFPHKMKKAPSCVNISQTDLLDVPFTWKDQESQSLLKPRNETHKLVLNGDVLCDCPEVLRNCPHKTINAPSFINTSQTELLDVPFTWKNKESQSILKRDDDIPVLKEDVCDCPKVPRNCPHQTKNAPHPGVRKEHLFQDFGSVFSSEECELMNPIISDETISSPSFPIEIFTKNSSDSPGEEFSSTQAVKSIQEKIKQIRDEQLREKYRKSELLDDRTVVSHVPVIGGEASQKVNTEMDVHGQDMAYIETSPSHKVDQWLNNHFNKKVQPHSAADIELKIEDFDSEEKGINRSNMREAAVVDKENLDLSNIMETQSTPEKVTSENENTQNIKRRKITEDVNAEEFQPQSYRITEVNTESYAITELNTESYRITEVNTEKFDHHHCSNDLFQIESPNSPEAVDGDMESAARILMSFSQPESPPEVPSTSREKQPEVPSQVPGSSREKIIKFKPGSLGARLRMELNKQKSAAEIWKYEVSKARESQDDTTLAELFQGQLDLTMLSCWSEYSHVVVKAVKSTTRDTADKSNTVLLLLTSSDFPKRLRQQTGQHFSIFPPWTNQWIAELEMSFLMNIQRIVFYPTTSRIQESVATQDLPLDCLDEDFYMKLIGLEEGLFKSKN